MKAFIALGFAAAAVTLTAQSPGFEDLLDRVTDYVTVYRRDFIGVVSEETYRQEVKGRMVPDNRGLAVEQPGQKRELKSDVLLVRAAAGDRWLQFRDVFEVDGKPVRDRAERIAKLFLTPSASAQRQVDDITAESARYNIGGVNRNVNLPTLALTALDPENRAWFTLSGARKKDGWEIEFREQRGGTLIRTTGDQSMPSRGHFTIDPNGRVLGSQMIAEGGTLHAQIDVIYAQDPAVNMFVPREMREKYTTSNGMQIEGRATYTKFRRYTVTVDEKVTDKKK
jgi:hypothetical protein